MRIVDWVARTAMLALAALATLALIGSLASVSNSPISNVFPGQVAAADAQPAPDISLPAAAATESTAAESPDTVTAPMVVQTLKRIAERRDSEAARWIRALTYAVIALAAVAAAGVVALVRIGGHLARMADR